VAGVWKRSGFASVDRAIVFRVMAMNTNSRARALTSTTLVLLIFAGINAKLMAQGVVLDPGKMPALGRVDERFQSYNIEMVEVTGGRFWKPYSSQPTAANPPQSSRQAGAPIAGLGGDLFQYRPQSIWAIPGCANWRQRWAPRMCA
jgi:hypothetical protein